MLILDVVKYAIYNINKFTICIHLANISVEEIYVSRLLNLLSDGKLHYKCKGNNKQNIQKITPVNMLAIKVTVDSCCLTSPVVKVSLNSIFLGSL
jgi:hypothetical protein